ncbi:MAG: hypothetical protein Q8O68_00825 [Candidatus Daviesbacteria bacterium]|nr:hypothetical protein [Candidatus Daviesbacteria bacterium]
METKHIFIEEFSVDMILPEDIIIFGAWHNLYAPLLNQIKNKRGILWTSTILQAELSLESVELKIFESVLHLHKTKLIDFVLIGDKKLADTFEIEGIIHFPYPIKQNKGEFVPPLFSIPSTNVGLFTVNHPRKNRTNQLMAVLRANKKSDKQNIRFISNCSSLNSSCPTLINKTWMIQEEYDQTLRSIQFGINVFICESFCYSFSELMCRGIPTITSYTVAKNFDLHNDDFLTKSLIVYDPDDVIEISEKILKLNELSLEDKEKLSKKCYEFMNQFSEKNNAKCVDTINRLYCYLGN